MDAIETLLGHRQARRRIESLGGLAPADAAAGYALQHAIAGRLGALPPAGFKIGATTQRMQAYLGLDGPAAGFMVAADLHPDGTRLPFADQQQPGVECEIGVRLGRDLPAGPCSQAQAMDAVAAVFPAIELVENRYPDLRELGTPTLIADRVFHAAAILGDACAGWRDLDLGALPGEILVDGVSRGTGHGRDLLGHPLAALCWLAESEAALRFGGLRAGQVVMLGSVTPPIWLDGPGRVEIRFGALGSVCLVLA